MPRSPSKEKKTDKKDKWLFRNMWAFATDAMYGPTWIEIAAALVRANLALKPCEAFNRRQLRLQKQVTHIDNLFAELNCYEEGTVHYVDILEEIRREL